MQDLLNKKRGKIDKIFYCPHIEEDNCTCRKPKTGLMQKIKEHYSISLEKIPAIGDSTRDLEAYSKSEAQPILVRTGNGKDVEKSKSFPSDTIIFDNLLEASKFIVKME